MPATSWHFCFGRRWFGTPRFGYPTRQPILRRTKPVLPTFISVWSVK